METNNLRKFQLTLLEVLLMLADFLKENKIPWFLIGGCALGAVRHNGFIPWDDDIDIGMMRKDFERFEALDFAPLLKHKLLYCPIGKNVIQNAPIGFLYDRRDESIGYTECPTIDIFPIDYVPDSNFKRCIQQISSLIYHLSTSRLAAKNRGKLSYVFTKAIVTLTPPALFRLYARLAKKIMLGVEKNQTAYVCNIFGMLRYRREIIKASYIKNTILHEFEGYSLPIPAEYHDYLTSIYGDYMKLPPPEQQVPHHKEF